MNSATNTIAAKFVMLLTIGFIASGSTGCGGLEKPTYQTKMGVQVYLNGQNITAEEVDEAVVLTLENFKGRWPEDRLKVAIENATITFVDSDEYELNGAKVAGNVSSDGNWIYVAVKTRTLEESALVHELVHYFDIQTTDHTDGTHETWKGQVQATIKSINQSLKTAAPQAQ